MLAFHLCTASPMLTFLWTGIRHDNSWMQDVLSQPLGELNLKPVDHSYDPKLEKGNKLEHHRANLMPIFLYLSGVQGNYLYAYISDKFNNKTNVCNIYTHLLYKIFNVHIS